MEAALLETHERFQEDPEQRGLPQDGHEQSSAKEISQKPEAEKTGDA
jgi:hypothetical protein